MDRPRHRKSIRQLGNKITAREIAVRAGAPLVAGSDGPVSSAAEARAFAEEHGLPLAIKAAFGGGGRGLKVVRELAEVEEAFDSAVREAVAAFGRGECFVEQYLDRPRHVEAQVIADKHGNVVVVGTRDCSLQRRHQKLVEEAPAPFLSDDQRQQIYDGAKAVCREAGYYGAGTVEFLVSADGTVAFLEVNTRLQVEHPITEETTGIDLVQEQFRIAAGLNRCASRRIPSPRGHSFEFRINAEDVGRGFLPSPGTVAAFSGPTGPGIRLDTGVRSGSVRGAAVRLAAGQADRHRRGPAAGPPPGTPRPGRNQHHAAWPPSCRSTGPSWSLRTSRPKPGSASTPAGSKRTSRTDPGGPGLHTSVPDGERRTITVDVDGKRLAVGLPADLLDGWARSGGPVPAGLTPVDGPFGAENDGGTAAGCRGPR